MAKKREAKTKKHAPGGTKKKLAKKAAANKRSNRTHSATGTAAKKTAAHKSAKGPVKKRPVSRKKKVSLGRPRVTGEEKLYLLFKEDSHARQSFAFLNVETVRELEQYSAQDIVKLLSQPIRNTVKRIRRKLADKNRCLLDDEEFALLHKAEQS